MSGITPMEENQEHRTGLEVAVIGMAARLPGAKNIHEFWENLKNARECISFFSDDELAASGIDRELLENPKYVKAKGMLEDIEYFDALFFNFSPGEAEMMDPQLRIFHECTQEALESAGYNPQTYDGLIGVYAGANSTVSWLTLNLTELDSINADPSQQFAIGNINSRDYLSTQVSYKLNLTGPGITVQTACSTSLVAIHQACQSLIGGDCDIALAGGVSVFHPEISGYLYQEGLVNSPDGHCRAFDANAKGTVFGDGIGIVVLKRLEEATHEGDHIYAVIKGSAVNNDGNRKVDFTAPSVKGQAAVIKNAYHMAEVEPGTVTYIETHGTGTSLGDPIEVEALKRVFNTGKKGYCAIGSVKSNIGHLVIAAGVAGFIKAVLALTHRLIPPSLHFKSPNPEIDFNNSPFYVNTRLTEWKSNGQRLRAGVSSFGIGGTNAHVVLEEWPDSCSPGAGSKEQAAGREYQLILLSAKTQNALDRISGNLLAYLKQDPTVNLADVAYTLQIGRLALNHRKMLVCSRVNEAIEMLSEPTSNSGMIREFLAEDDPCPVIFMFSGQGAQYVNMGLGLYQAESSFREKTDQCFDILKPIVGYDMKTILYPCASYNDAREKDISDEVRHRINRTQFAQPLIFTFEFALARLLMEWGIQPYALIGHSIGEYVAACLSGVLSLEDALTLVTLRGKWMQEMPPGSMVSVPLPEEQLTPFLKENPGLSLAAVNSTSLCVVSGRDEAIADLINRLKEKGHQCSRLHTSHAFHSQTMDPVKERLLEQVRQVPLNEPQIPYISNTTGKRITAAEAKEPGYWAHHLRATVRFSQGLAELLKEEKSIFIELGPGRALSTFARQHKDKKPAQEVLNLVRHPKEKLSDSCYLLSKIGQLWLSGINIDGHAYYAAEKRQRIPLPGYPFESRRCWRPDNTPTIQVRKKSDIADWFYIPSWKRSKVPVRRIQSREAPGPAGWLVFVNQWRLGYRLAEQLEQKKHPVVLVKTGPEFSRVKPGEYMINPASDNDYHALFDDLSAAGRIPQKILHLWSVTEKEQKEFQPQGVANTLDLGYYSLLNLAQAINKKNIHDPLQITVLTNNMQEVAGGELQYPEKAAVLGPVKVIPLEHPNINCRSIDIVLPGSKGLSEKQLMEQLLAELQAETIDSAVIAYRGHHRWVQTFEPVHLEPPGESISISRLKQRGVYLITGGLGGIGLVLAEHLAKTLEARLILTDRSQFPPGGQWNRWLTQNEPNEQAPVSNVSTISSKIRKIRELEKAGAEVLICQADAANHRQMQEVTARAQERFGKINGIIHAAGLPDGALIQRRSRDQSETLFAAKVRGTRVLDRLFKGASLDFFLLCSSLLAIDAPIGQVGYCAANAFLDAFAYHRFSRDGQYTVSINWDGWKEVGMAVEAAKPGHADSDTLKGPFRDVDHPLFNRSTLIDPRHVVYISHFNPDKHWVLDEHRVNKDAVLPGTAYLEMVTAALQDHVGAGNSEIREIFFMAPLMVNSHEDKEVRTILEKQEDEEGFEFCIKSRVGPGAKENQWQEHARGKIAPQEPVPASQPAKHDIAEIASACNKEEITAAPQAFENQTGLVTFGPRWNILKQVKLGDRQGLALLELPREFTPDLEFYRLHPALMDFATSFMAGQVKDKGELHYLPFSYINLKINAPLPQRILSHIKPLEEENTGSAHHNQKKSMSFNVTIMDEQGVERVHIEAFTMIAVEDTLVSGKPAGVPARESHPTLFEQGISSTEGIEVFHRVLAESLPQVLVSTLDLKRRSRQGKTSGASHPGEDVETVKGSRSRNPRPRLKTKYVAPSTTTERTLVRIWQEFLGIEQVGVHDDFFDLGGDSLKAITVTGKIHKEMHVEIPIADFFNRSTTAALARYIADTAKGTYSLIEPVEKRDYYPQSSAQKRLFILHRFENTGISYNTPILYKIKGKPNKERLERLFKIAIQRHENFRTSFHMKDNQPVQKIHDTVDFEIEYYMNHEIHEIHEKNNKLQVTNRETGENEGFSPPGAIIKNFVRPFDLSNAPLLRVGLAALQEDEYLLLIDIHHIIADGTSVLIFMEEFFGIYKEEPLPDLQIQYKDFAVWQDHLPQTGKTGKQEEYWLKLYADTPNIPRLNLETDYPRPKSISYQGDCFGFNLGKEDTLKLRKLCTGNGATLYMVLLAAFNVLLYKYTGQNDIIVGSHVEGRLHTDTLDIMGMFVNSLAMRNYPEGEKTYRQFLAEVKENSLKAFENQGMQFEELIQQLNLARDAARNPLFDVVFNVQNFGGPLLDKNHIEVESNITITPYEYEDKTSKFDMILFVYEMDEGIFFNLRYSTVLFKESTIEKMAKRYIEILQQVTADENIKLEDIKISHDFRVTDSHISHTDFRF